MNKNIFKGDNEIESDKNLKVKTKKKVHQSPIKKNDFFLKRNLVIWVVPIIAVAVVLTILFSNSVFSRQVLITAKAQDFMQGIKPQDIDVSSTITNNFIISTQNFSVNLFKQTYKSGDNTLVSPTSAFLALGMTANGASGTTLDAFKNVLGKYGLTVDDLNKAYKAYTNELTEKHGSTTLDISNSIWFRNDFKANKEFLQDNANFFGAGAKSLDFSDKNSVDVINNWVKDSTNGKIDKIVDKLSSDDVMYLINALYFDAKWQNPFDTTEPARSGAFNLDNGSAKQVTYMNLVDNLDYVKSQNESSVLLPYDDGRFAFLCILPSGGTTLKDYINTMTDRTIPDLLKQGAKTEVSVTLPQFTVTSDNQLNDTLKSVGLSVAFDGNKADFSKMGESKNNLFIGSVRQKTFLQVNELGTEAAAATSVGMTESLVLDTKDINFTRPFIYAVIDTKTNLPLFLGAMEDPQSTLAAHS